MPKVLRIINRLNLGGPTFNVAMLTKHLKPEFETMVVSGMKDEAEASSEFILDELGIRPTYIPKMFRSVNPLNDIPAYRDIKRIIKEFKPDVVHTHAAKAGTLGRLAAFECGVPVTLHTFHGHVFHSYFGPLKTRFYLEVERYLAKRTSRIVAISNEQKRELGEVYKVCDPNKIQVVPLGFDLNRFMEDQINKRIDFRAHYKIADDEVAVGIVGRLVPIKNHPLFLEALKKAIQISGKKVRAFIVGDGEERMQLQQLCNEMGLNYSVSPSKKATVTFTSWITRVDEVYAGLDVVALSSLNEGTPVSLIEAQAANKPIVTTQVGGVSDVVIDGQTALMSPSGDVDAFAAHLAQLISDAALRQKMGANGRANVVARYSYQRLVGDVSRLYDQLLMEVDPNYRPKSAQTGKVVALPHLAKSHTYQPAGKVSMLYK